MESYESIAACAAALNINPSLLKLAKRNGCDAFMTGGRINTRRAVRFLFEMLSTSKAELPEGFSSWMDVLNSERAKREKIKREQDEGSTMLTAEAKRQAGEAMGLTFAELERRDRELPPALAGLTAIEIFKRMRRDTETIRKTLHEKFNAE